jgi:hypothetical protein
VDPPDPLDRAAPTLCFGLCSGPPTRFTPACKQAREPTVVRFPVRSATRAAGLPRRNPGPGGSREGQPTPREP